MLIRHLPFCLLLLFLFNSCRLYQGLVLATSIIVFAGSLLALGAIVSAKPLDDLGYKVLTGDDKRITSPYASSLYLGWAMVSAIALIVSGVLPIVSWFATYRFSLSSAICVGIFAGNIRYQLLFQVPTWNLYITIIWFVYLGLIVLSKDLNTNFLAAAILQLFLWHFVVAPIL